MEGIIEGYRFANLSEKDLELPFNVMSVGRENQVKLYRPNGLIDHQFLFTVSGAGEVVLNDKKITVEANTLLYHAPNTEQKYYPLTFQWNVCWITFRQALSFFSVKSGVYPLEDVDKFSEIIDEVLELEQSVNYGEQSSIILYRLLLETKRSLENFQYNESSHKLKEAMNYINKFFFYDIELDELSRRCNLSTEYFCRLFKKTYGITAFSYIKTLRIQEAKKRLLLNKKQSLFQIAKSVGYHSVNYFVTDFKRFENITPTEFRSSHQTLESPVFNDMK